ncbi:MAG TPA: S41 family peptidase, partial [Pirellula sp.]|nr:S41 family peptidase [Pirellula sp.]
MRTRIQSKRKRSTRKAFLTFLCTSILATPLALLGRLIADELPRVSQLSEPPENTRLIVRTVRLLVEKAHILHPKINDEVSARAFAAFLKNIDPMKSYFLASDIEEFKPYETKLDDLLRRNDIQFAYVAYRKYLERLEQIIPMVHQQIDAEHDFTVAESIAADAKEIGFAKDFDEITDRWRKTIKLSILSLRSGPEKSISSSVPTPSEEKSDTEIKETLHKRYRNVYNMKSKTDVDELLELYLTSITTVLDPHTTYMAPQESADFGIHLKLELKGIGATLRPDDGATVVESVVPGGAADLDGRIKMGDQIVAVAQDDGSSPVETQDMKLKDVVKMIRGEAGTRVKLHVKTKASGDIHVYEITRALIKLEDSAARSEIIEDGAKPDGAPYKFGYINLPSFYLDMDGARSGKANFRSTTADMRRILTDFRNAKVDAVVLDLSRNGGGSLPESVSTTGLFIDRGSVVQVKSPDGQVESLDDEERGVAWDGPLIVKISQMSASASEIFAGAIQDYGRGIIVGDPKTHGKGTVQTLMDLAPYIDDQAAKKAAGALKLTIQQFYLPDGRSTQLEGVSSDVVLPSITAKLDISESDLEYPLPADRVPPRPHKNYRMVDSATKIMLQQAADQRIAK